MNRTKITTAALIYGTYVCIATLYPFELSRDPLHSLGGALAQSFARFGPKDFFVNVALFIPFGALFYFWWAPSRSKASVVLFATLAGALTSLSIELLQVWFTRQPSGYDFLSNTLGAAAGALLALACPAGFSDPAYRCWQKAERAGVALSLALLLGAVPLVVSIAQLLAPFGIWDSRFTFQIGNEATYNRPWLGKIHLVALYSRALAADEVARHFHRGPSALNMPSTDDVVALYAFNEGSGNIVRDVSGFEPALDLSFSPKGRVRWLDGGNGIEIVKPSIVRSNNPPTKLYEALRATDALSIEVWMTPDNTVQGGPARIVSFSRNTSERNFTLGQEGHEIEFRLRTPVSGMNGTPLALKTTKDISPSEISHVIATYKHGVERFYLNGQQQSEVLDLTSHGVIGFGTKKTPITQIAYCFFYFFPVGFLFAIFLSRLSKGLVTILLLPAGIATGLLVVTELFQSFAFDRGIDTTLISYGMMIATLGGLSGRSLVTKDRLA
jgi:glycopeptide antibiotics resistance protein